MRGDVNRRGGEGTPAALREERSVKFAFTCDDVGGTHSQEAVEWFETVIEWLNGRRIPGTFFWVPKPGNRPSSEDALWLNPILRARAQGHDFQLHGLTHGSCLEFGVPQESIRRHAPKAFEEYEANRARWDREHSVEEQRKKLHEGAEIYTRAFGEAPLIFRAPCFGMCANAYQALSEVGIRYSSSRSVNPAATGYMITRRPELEPWQPDYDGRPFQVPAGVTEIPCLEDVVIFGVKEEEFDFALNLFKREIKNYMQGLGSDGLGVFGSHYTRIGRQRETITRLYDQLFAWMSEQGVTEWVTFRDAVKATG